MVIKPSIYPKVSQASQRDFKLVQPPNDDRGRPLFTSLLFRPKRRLQPSFIDYSHPNNAAISDNNRAPALHQPGADGLVQEVPSPENPGHSRRVIIQI